MKLLRNLIRWISVSTAAALLPAADLPRPTPNTVFRLAEGGAVDLSQYKGKVVALEFLLTTCSHCQRTARALGKMNEEYGAKGFQPLGVATNEMAHMFTRDFVREQHLTFPVAYTDRDTCLAFLQHPSMLIMYFPQLVFIDKKGMIRSQYAGGDKFFSEPQEQNMRVEIEKLLKEGLAPPVRPSTSAPKKAPPKKAG